MFSQNRMLCIAVVASILVHAIILVFRWGISLPFDLKKDKSTVELVLVNPFPKKSVDMDLIGKDKDVRTLVSGKEVTYTTEVRSKKANMSSIGKKTEMSSSGSSQIGKTDHSSERKMTRVTSGEGGSLQANDQENRSVVFRQNGKRAQTSTTNASESNGRPVITANTQDVGYSMYYKALRKRVENLGLINFPQHNGVRLYGELTVRIPVYYDGSLFEKEGGPSIERSSGNPTLDKAALDIIRRAAPFGPFPKSAHSKNGGADVWIIITRLKFTRDQGIQSQVRSTVQ